MYRDVYWVIPNTQSDEITLVLVDYKELTSDSWFSSEVQKICSISASMATMKFNNILHKHATDYVYVGDQLSDDDNDSKYGDLLLSASGRAMFDSRCFNIPKEEVTNNIYWRQLDASRNSIMSLAQSHFSHKELHKISCNKAQDMLMVQKGINWNDLPVHKKRGTCVIKTTRIPEEHEDDGYNNYRKRYNEDHPITEWVIDKDIPIFKGEGREYIDKLINF